MNINLFNFSSVVFGGGVGIEVVCFCSSSNSEVFAKEFFVKSNSKSLSSGLNDEWKFSSSMSFWILAANAGFTTQIKN